MKVEPPEEPSDLSTKIAAGTSQVFEGVTLTP